MSIDEAEPVFLYSLSGFLSFVGAVHSASPPPPSLCVLPPLETSLPSCSPSLRVLPPFLSFLTSCTLMRQGLFFSTYLAISSPLLEQSIGPLPLLPPFVSFPPLCPPSRRVLPPLRVLPPFMSIDEAEPVLLYFLGDFLSFVLGAVHCASPPLPSCLILSVMKSNFLPLLRLTKDTYHISLHGLLVHNPPHLCPAHSSKTGTVCYLMESHILRRRLS